jgi:hypothetical protein
MAASVRGSGHRLSLAVDPMPRRALDGPPAVLLAAALTACGSSSAAAPCRPPAATDPPAPGAQAGVVSLAADRGRVDGGGSVEFTARVIGPARFHAECTGPLQVVVGDSADIHVFSAAPPATRGVPCGVVRLPRGRAAEYAVSWPVDPTLPPGLYDATVILGDQPPAVLQVRVGPMPVTGCP